MLLNNIILSSKLPPLITSLRITSVDLTLFHPSITSVLPFFPSHSDNYSTILSSQLLVSLNSSSPITIYLDGSITFPSPFLSHSFRIKYIFTFSGVFLLKLYQYPCHSVYFSFYNNPLILGDFSLISQTQWVKKYAFTYIMNIVQMVKNHILSEFTYPKMTCIPV
ncbi:hypothetical protein ENUP19_0225G0001 [Entamoeba nuttalli]|uniref:Uncharacterized protein n=1 Tax=Entamoeba nuttalli TaxID=412467 RepID=A0ABQ0DQ06_9EUKA